MRNVMLAMLAVSPVLVAVFFVGCQEKQLVVEPVLEPVAADAGVAPVEAPVVEAPAPVAVAESADAGQM
jgi:hypothetical protein